MEDHMKEILGEFEEIVMARLENPEGLRELDELAGRIIDNIQCRVEENHFML